MNLKTSAALVGIGIGGLQTHANAQDQSALTDLKFTGSVTSFLNDKLDLGALTNFTLSKDRDFRIQGLFEKPATSNSLLDSSVIGLDAQMDKLGINLGAAMQDGEIDFSRVAFRYRETDGSSLRLTYADTPTDEQVAIDGRANLDTNYAMQGIIDDLGNFRARIIWQGKDEGLSVAAGQSNDEWVTNISYNSDAIWVSGAYRESVGAQLRLLLGDIPKNRSDLYAEVNNPGANDITIFKDQTARTAIGQNPTFGLLAFAPQTFLAAEPGSLVFDFIAQQHGRISGRATVRLGDLGPLNDAWLAAGLYNVIDQGKTGATVEVGAGTNAGNFRLLGDVSEGQDLRIGLLWEIKF